MADLAYFLQTVAVPTDIVEVRIQASSGGGVAVVPRRSAHVQSVPHNWRILPGTPAQLARYLRSHAFHPETGDEDPLC